MEECLISNRASVIGSDRSLREWRLLRVRSRREKPVSRLLSAIGIVNCVPYASERYSYGGANVSVEVPLFPGYVFFHGTQEDARRALGCEGVVGSVSPESGEQLQWELSNLFFAMTSEAALASCSPIAEGIRAEVFDGPMRGLQGYCGSGNGELVLQVETLKRAVSLKVDTRRARTAENFRSRAV